MQRKIITTADGSKTIQIEEWNEQYHSVHGAIQEANHVYIKHGLLFYFNEIALNKKQPLSILEVGFGTGLNALLTLMNYKKLTGINYVGVEAFPVSKAEIEQLNYNEQLKIDSQLLTKLHDTGWENSVEIEKGFKLIKQNKRFKNITNFNEFDIIYFDAFGPRVQPELWTEAMFKTMFEALKRSGILVTYSAKGSVRRAMQSVGFKVERLEGPPGKREMLRALKP
ncbi:tRNA (5-methylaminomethyl-2-thiouridine)(34)-methyltransferase MnmD [uncultured Psychroserpens sp.]|uniref:tRNA (5-methylaminomethyl-2-thiouridine)(34)-methyltransferase MnmD n=1 Tax=uncultured Psychroserpens sp. TaxID=255436 RepID=UPI0026191CED|nr:tRNA (5-methylaminomethyl-2-thiouridine)(34)-methyltransferase MnmD [uncultured Psychroserpens sp.]